MALPLTYLKISRFIFQLHQKNPWEMSLVGEEDETERRKLHKLLLTTLNRTRLFWAVVLFKATAQNWFLRIVLFDIFQGSRSSPDKLFSPYFKSNHSLKYSLRSSQFFCVINQWSCFWYRERQTDGQTDSLTLKSIIFLSPLSAGIPGLGHFAWLTLTLLFILRSLAWCSIHQHTYLGTITCLFVLRQGPIT